MSIRTLLICLLCTLLYLTKTAAQDIGHGNIPDSLLQLSYQDLRDIYYPLMYEDSTAAFRYINAHIKKAKIEVNNLEIVAGYRKMANTLKLFESYDSAITYTDSILKIGIDLRNNDYISTGYASKGNIEYYSGQYRESFENYNLARKYVPKENHGLSIEVHIAISAFKVRSKDYDGALQISIEVLDKIKSLPDYKKEYRNYYLATLSNISLDYMNLRQYENAKNMLKLV